MLFAGVCAIITSLPCTLTELLAASFLGGGAERGRVFGLTLGDVAGAVGGFDIRVLPGNFRL